MKELYEKYRGYYAQLGNFKGKVAGYTKQYLIMRLESDRGWKLENSRVPIIFLEPYTGDCTFLYIEEDSIIKFKFGR